VVRLAEREEELVVVAAVVVAELTVDMLICLLPSPRDAGFSVCVVGIVVSKFVTEG